MNENYRGWYVVLTKSDAVSSDSVTFLAVAQTERSARQQAARQGYRRQDGWRVDRIGPIKYAHAWRIHQ